MNEIGNRGSEKMGLWEKAGVEDGHEFALQPSQALSERAGFVAFAVAAVNVNDGHALGGVAFDAAASDLASLIGRVIQYLHVEQFRRIVETGNRFDEPFNHVAFIEDRQLHRDSRPI